MAPSSRLIAWLAAWLFLLLSGFAAAWAQQPPDPGFLSAQDGARIIEKLGDTEKSLGDEAVLMAHFAGLVSPPEETSTLHQLTGNVPGLVYVLPMIHGDVHGTLIEVRLHNRAEADALRQQLVQRFGPADPACSDDNRANWALPSMRSLSWRLEVYESEAIAQLTLLASNPPDANCTVNAAPPNALVDKAALTALFQRIKTEPPPWADARAMAEWLKPYGEPNRQDVDQCSAVLDIMMPEKLGGIGMLSASLRLCGVPMFGKPSRLFLNTGDNDLKGFSKTDEALEAAFGARHAACSSKDRQVWVVAPDVTAVLTPLYPSFGLLIVNAPVTALADCRS
ncbi:hypothetical protein [Rhizobium paknamense]|uniref:Uncharacterized protein n=1 Tax=Rhizobium paknamense TaxID=1206817 RepID=A0ABU0IAF9_9HYPH|nr:hypothetical protein [Rhizobium paknamense]MDQ0455201.1 hypothetical protein [Rhizobium paknamense]